MRWHARGVGCLAPVGSLRLHSLQQLPRVARLLLSCTCSFSRPEHDPLGVHAHLWLASTPCDTLSG